MVVVAGAGLVWGGIRLHGQSAPDSAGASGVAAPAAAVIAPAAPFVGGATDGVGLATPGFSWAHGATMPPSAGLEGESVAAIPLPPSAYPGMVGLATAAYAGWRYRRRRR